MNNNYYFKDTNFLVKSAAIAALYAVLTLVVPMPQYGPIQFRFSEILVLLVFYNKKYMPGLLLGCAIANIFSPMAWFDVIFGTLSSYIAFRLMRKTDNIFIASLFPVIMTSVPALGTYFILDNSTSFIMMLASFMASEFVMVSIIGIIIFKIIEKNSFLINFIKEF